MTALSDHGDRLKEIGELLKYVAPEVDPEVGLSEIPRRPFSDSTLARSCVVLGISYFEGFLKDLADEAFDAVISSEIACNALSANLRGRAVENNIRNLRQNDDPADNWRALTSLVSTTMQLSAGSKVTEDLLPRDEVKRAVTSIEPNKINELFRALGDDDLNRGPMSKFGTQLRTLKQIRDNAVHGNEADLAPLSLGDVVRWMDLLSACADAMNIRTNVLLGKLGVTTATDSLIV